MAACPVHSLPRSFPFPLSPWVSSLSFTSQPKKERASRLLSPPSLFNFFFFDSSSFSHSLSPILTLPTDTPLSFNRWVQFAAPKNLQLDTPGSPRTVCCWPSLLFLQLVPCVWSSLPVCPGSESKIPIDRPIRKKATCVSRYLARLQAFVPQSQQQHATTGTNSIANAAYKSFYREHRAAAFDTSDSGRDGQVTLQNN